MPRKLIDLTGQIFGRLTVTREAPRSHPKHRRWYCNCSCGNTDAIVHQDSLRVAHTQSCGCLQQERAVEANTKHGDHGTPAYRSWQAMLNRCRRKGTLEWPNYGGRGITVCDRWRSFENFLSDMGPRPADHTIDRINNNGNYEPGNCRWVNRTTQNNNARSNVRITYQDRTQNATQWAREIGMNPEVLMARIRKGWSAEEALTTPVGGKRKA